MNASIQSKTLEKKIYTAFIIAVVVTLFLFFIDEGYYNFKWVTDPGNWIAFVIYVTLLFIPQLILIAFVLPYSSNRPFTILKFIIGVIVGVAGAFLWLG